MGIQRDHMLQGESENSVSQLMVLEAPIMLFYYRTTRGPHETQSKVLWAAVKIKKINFESKIILYEKKSILICTF